MRSVARLCPDQSFLSLCHRRRAARMCMMYTVRTHSHGWFIVCSESCHLLLPEFNIPHPIKFGPSKPQKFVRCFLPAQGRMYNNVPYTGFHTGTLDGFKGVVKR